MSNIAKDNPVVTLVNVFTVAAENQQRLIDLLIQATEQTMKHLPGFVSASIHRSFDGTKVVNYAQWCSRADFDAMRQSPPGATAYGGRSGAGGVRSDSMRGG